MGTRWALGAALACLLADGCHRSAAVAPAVTVADFAAAPARHFTPDAPPPTAAAPAESCPEVEECLAGCDLLPWAWDDDATRIAHTDAFQADFYALAENCGWDVESTSCVEPPCIGCLLGPRDGRCDPGPDSPLLVVARTGTEDRRPVACVAPVMHDVRRARVKALVAP